MLWECFSSMGKRKLDGVDGKMNGDKYRKNVWYRAWDVGLAFSKNSVQPGRNCYSQQHEGDWAHIKAIENLLRIQLTEIKYFYLVPIHPFLLPSWANAHKTVVQRWNHVACVQSPHSLTGLAKVQVMACWPLLIVYPLSHNPLSYPLTIK